MSLYNDIIGAHYPVEIGDDVGDEFVGDDFDFVGDDYAGEDFVLAGYDEVGAPVYRRKAPRRAPMRRPMQRPMRGPGGMVARRPAAPSPMQMALAERRALAGAILDKRGPTKAREYPLGFASAAAVAAGASARITTRPQVPFRIDRLVVPSDIAGLFTIDDVKVGKNSQFAAEGAVPARIFQENGVGVTLKGDTAQVSMDVTISVTNISGAAATFRAAIIGPAVE